MDVVRGVRAVAEQMRGTAARELRGRVKPRGQPGRACHAVLFRPWETMRMRVEDVMSRDVEFLGGDSSAREAAELMGELDVGSLPIGSADALDGIVTDRDILYRLVARGLDPARHGDPRHRVPAGDRMPRGRHRAVGDGPDGGEPYPTDAGAERDRGRGGVDHARGPGARAAGRGAGVAGGVEAS